MMVTARTCFGFFVATLMLLASSTAQAAVHNVANDFSASNPSGVWSYGFTNGLGGVFTQYVNQDNLGESNLLVWNQSAGSSLAVFQNTDSSPGVFAGTVGLGGKEVAIHPGPNGEFSVIRFTAPSSGQYSVSSVFSGRSISPPNPGTSTDVHVLVNNSSIFDGFVNGYGPSSDTPFGGSLTLNAGDTIDFVVGYGNNNNYSYDSTALAATIAATPEPATLAIWGGIGLCGLVAGYRRKRLARS